jgi:hypothetical protein
MTNLCAFTLRKRDLTEDNVSKAYQFGFWVTVTTAQKTRGCTGPMAGDSKRVYALKGKEEWRVPEGCQRI